MKNPLLILISIALATTAPVRAGSFPSPTPPTHPIPAHSSPPRPALSVDSAASDDSAPHASPTIARAAMRAEPGSGCLGCHRGIEDIRSPDSGMMAAIRGLGVLHGDPEGCVICHGGNPEAVEADSAHKGAPAALSKAGGPDNFFPDPGSLFIAEKTCGQCHANYAYRLQRSLMNTEAGKIQGNLHTWGVEETRNYNVPWGNYDVEDTDGPVPSVGTPAYKEYMTAMIAAHPKQFPTSLKQIPLPSVEEIEKDPKLAGFTYQRQQCQRCHVSVRGRERRGDFRGMGCTACHVLYSNEGYYEGGDPTIDREERGHMLSHRIVGTREAGGGIPVESCNSCHNRGKRIGVTYQGLMEFPYGSPFAPDKQPKLHTKNYLFIADDLHHQVASRPENPEGGLLCQDCHTSVDMHGDGNIFGTTLAQVEIECQDCHGTTGKFPWELPLGHGEEFGRTLPQTPRGVGSTPSPESAFGTAYDREDGYLLTARGNPFGNVIRRGDQVILHSATGLDFEVPVLKTLSDEDSWQTPDAKVAMESVEAHMDNLECYTCHASWVPQCYGCHVKVDYSAGEDGEPKTDIDWISSGSAQTPDGQTAESRLGTGGIHSAGKVAESRSYLRWEEPVLGINGEGRVTPLMPGCQVVWTVIDREGKTLVSNMIAKSPDEAVAAGQEHVPLAIDMAPVQPHSAQRRARRCESCHNSEKAVGYGIGGGVFQNQHARPLVVDLKDARTGEVIPKRTQIQSAAIPNLDFDLSRIVDPEDGRQLATVGTHWPLSRAFNKEEIDGILRIGLCMGCHREMPKKDLWSAVAEPGRLSDKDHTELMNKMFRAYHKKKTGGE